MMAKKLIATPFAYSMLSAMGDRSEYLGSYLGRKPATRTTLCAFMRRNGIFCGFAVFKPHLISIGNAYESQWIAR